MLKEIETEGITSTLFLKVVIVVIVIVITYGILAIINYLLDGYIGDNNSSRYNSKFDEKPLEETDGFKSSFNEPNDGKLGELSLNGKKLVRYEFDCDVNIISFATEAILFGKEIDKNEDFNITKPEIKVFFNKRDINKDKSISQAEYSEYIIQRGKPFTSILFDSLDKNQDNKITAKEVVSCLE